MSRLLHRVRTGDTDEKPACRYCGHLHVWSYGRNTSGTRKYKCCACRRAFVLVPEKIGIYPASVRRNAVRRVLAGESWKQVAFEIGCDLRTIRKWIEATGATCACGRKLCHVGMCREKYHGVDAVQIAA